MREWAKRKNVSLKNDSNQALIENQSVIDRIQKEIDHYNNLFGGYEQIKKFELLPEEMSVEGGELTPTLKLKRKVIMDIHADRVKKIYGEG